MIGTELRGPQLLADDPALEVREAEVEQDEVGRPLP